MYGNRNAFLVQLHLRIHRNDLAVKQLAKLKAIDEDSVLSMLCNAWIHMSNVRNNGILPSQLIISVSSVTGQISGCWLYLRGTD